MRVAGDHHQARRERADLRARVSRVVDRRLRGLHRRAVEQEGRRPVRGGVLRARAARPVAAERRGGREGVRRDVADEGVVVGHAGMAEVDDRVVGGAVAEHAQAEERARRPARVGRRGGRAGAGACHERRDRRDRRGGENGRVSGSGQRAGA